VKGLLLFDSALDLTVVIVALRDREGTASAADNTALSTSLGRSTSHIQARTTNKATGSTRRAFFTDPTVELDVIS
jgi:hypothetical protein